MKSGILKVESTDGTAIDVVWPPCGEEVLGNAVVFQIGRKILTLAINSLPSRMDFSSGDLPVFEGHYLSNKVALQVMDWLKTAEISPEAVKFP